MYFDHSPFSLRERVCVPREDNSKEDDETERRTAESVATTLESPPGANQGECVGGAVVNSLTKSTCSARKSLLKSASISASKCVNVKPKIEPEVCTSPFWKFKRFSSIKLFRFLARCDTSDFQSSN